MRQSGVSVALSGDAAQHLYKILVNDLPACGCGNPETAYKLVHDLLKLAPFYEHSYGEIAGLIGTPGAYHLVLGSLDQAGLIEHGGGIGGSWLTPKGKWCLWVLDSAGDLDAVLDQPAGLPHDGGDCSDLCWPDTPSNQQLGS